MHESVLFLVQMSTISVILPTYNERENIAPLIATLLHKLKGSTEIIVVDDDSPDLTWQVVEEFSRVDPRVTLIRRVGRRGLVSALLEGITRAKGENIVWMDCDFSMPPEKLSELISALDNYDLAVGSRYISGGKDLRDSFLAVILGRAINLFASSLLRSRIKDLTSGFIAARRSVLDGIELAGDYGEYCIRLLHQAQRKGFRVVEIPYHCLPRRAGKSKTATNLLSFLLRGRKYVSTVINIRKDYFLDKTKS